MKYLVTLGHRVTLTHQEVIEADTVEEAARKASQIPADKIYWEGHPFKVISDPETAETYMLENSYPVESEVLGVIPHQEAIKNREQAKQLGKQKQERDDGYMFCEHPNENPYICRCEPNCYCKTHTCKDKIPLAPNGKPHETSAMYCPHGQGDGTPSGIACQCEANCYCKQHSCKSSTRQPTMRKNCDCGEAFSGGNCRSYCSSKSPHPRPVDWEHRTI